MKEKTKELSIFRAKDPEKLEVFRAASTENQIRFYINYSDYLASEECEEGFLIQLGKAPEPVEETDKKIKLKDVMLFIKENFKFFIILLSLAIFFIAMSVALLLGLALVTNSLVVFLFLMNITLLIIKTLMVAVFEMIETPPLLKSKHSAEHKMVNFLQNNRRLPRNIEELKKSSRFSPDCGSRNLVYDDTKIFVRNIISVIFASIVYGIVTLLFNSVIISSLVLMITYFVSMFFVDKFIIKHNKLDFIIKPIVKVLSYSAQCFNTTHKVKETDYYLVYNLARYWLNLVYPEFYNEDDEKYWIQYFRVNNLNSKLAI